jgi:hypothetical protein
MGKHTETVAVGIGWKDSHRCSCEAYHVGIGAQEDRGGSKSALGEG